MSDVVETQAKDLTTAQDDTQCHGTGQVTVRVSDTLTSETGSLATVEMISEIRTWHVLYVW